MLEHNENLQDDQEVFDFIGYVPEEWGQPKYWMMQKVSWLENGKTLSGTIIGLTYDDLEEEWDYEIAIDHQFRKCQTYSDRSDYCFNLTESGIDHHKQLLVLDQLFCNS
ncbi:hypothetical protein [Coleofasciculus sp. FACHB-SPT36]|uniref:hypothetical protein n=1 Tax=Cyanophyceae TaxID=3028117 RepID=UPI00168B6B64|nr:hypothetical protein [Coleofasciculus sp. FACHB-SPT36]MBD2537518.1 hypothetical protein [Coleofasciculus sp. FACHB-SPT36]